MLWKKALKDVYTLNPAPVPKSTYVCDSLPLKLELQHGSFRTRRYSLKARSCKKTPKPPTDPPSTGQSPHNPNALSQQPDLLNP